MHTQLLGLAKRSVVLPFLPQFLHFIVYEGSDRADDGISTSFMYNTYGMQPDKQKWSKK